MIINIKKSFFSIFQPLLSLNPNINICFLSKIDDINIDINNKSRIINNNDNFGDEIYSFNKEILLSKPCDGEIRRIWRYIKSCISGYLIKESYEKTKINRLDNFINFEKQKEATIALPTSNLLTGTKTTEISESLEQSSENSSSSMIPVIKEEEFIELRNIGTGSIEIVVLIYHIEREELYALKKQHLDDQDIYRLMKREIDNYSKVRHPLIPKLIGIGQNEKYLIINRH